MPQLYSFSSLVIVPQRPACRLECKISVFRFSITSIYKHMGGVSLGGGAISASFRRLSERLRKKWSGSLRLQLTSILNMLKYHNVRDAIRKFTGRSGKKIGFAIGGTLSSKFGGGVEVNSKVGSLYFTDQVMSVLQ